MIIKGVIFQQLNNIFIVFNRNWDPTKEVMDGHNTISRILKLVKQLDKEHSYILKNNLKT